MENKLRGALGGKPLRDAVLEVDESLLTQDTLKMALSAVPTTAEQALLLAFQGEPSTLDRPEQLLRSLCGIPRLEGRIHAMMFKAQLERLLDRS